MQHIVIPADNRGASTQEMVQIISSSCAAVTPVQDMECAHKDLRTKHTALDAEENI